mmetsp:Transcript_646/g.1606  ORF Transcript_646/g.1606 Transcript_646/m.1606 type:complete len:200 (-) Transcript_646:463-1062(-)
MVSAPRDGITSDADGNLPSSSADVSALSTSAKGTRRRIATASMPGEQPGTRARPVILRMGAAARSASVSPLLTSSSLSPCTSSQCASTSLVLVGMTSAVDAVEPMSASAAASAPAASSPLARRARTSAAATTKGGDDAVPASPGGSMRVSTRFMTSSIPPSRRRSAAAIAVVPSLYSPFPMSTSTSSPSSPPQSSCIVA